jgi:hypothetical protein
MNVEVYITLSRFGCSNYDVWSQLRVSCDLFNRGNTVGGSPTMSVEVNNHI